jgi:probable HAF family extracellular repeat protein
MTDLGTLGGDYAYAQAINSAGVITGYSYTANNQSLRAFQYANGVMTDLGLIQSQSRGNDINDDGQIVGWTYSLDGAQTGFLRTTGPVLDLNSLINVGETAGVNEARFINTPGQVLARGFNANATQWYVLTPTTLATSSLALTAAPGVFGGTSTLTATLTIANPAGALVRFTVNGSQVGTAFADAQGVATLANVALGSLPAGTNTGAAGAIFPGDATYAGSTAAADILVGKATPTITWNNPADISHGTALGGGQLNASSSVAGSFAYSPAAGTVLSAGDNQVLSVTFTPSNSNNYTTAVKTVSINVLRTSQTITFAAIASKTYGDAAFGLTATAPGGTVTFATGAGSIGCSVSGATVTITGATAAGQQCIIVASQGGNANYAPAPDVSRSFTIAKASQTITFAALAGRTYGESPFGLTATAAGGTVTFSLGSGSVGCSVSGSTATITGATAAGQSCIIVASQAGDTNYLGAPDVSRSFAIAKGSQTITFGALADKTYGDSPFALSATAAGWVGRVQPRQRQRRLLHHFQHRDDHQCDRSRSAVHHRCLAGR